MHRPQLWRPVIGTGSGGIGPDGGDVQGPAEGQVCSEEAYSVSRWIEDPLFLAAAEGSRMLASRLSRGRMAQCQKTLHRWRLKW